jgi:hypothetical protein
VPGGWALNRHCRRVRTLFILMAPFALVAFLVTVSTLLFLDGRKSESTLLGSLSGTKRGDYVLRLVELLSPIIVLPLCCLAIAWNRDKGSRWLPARVRLTVRDMMIWLAIVTAACFAGSRMWDRREQRMGLATMCGIASRGVRVTGATYRLDADRVTLNMLGDEGPLRATAAQVADRRRRGAYWDDLEQKYERAAASPWLSVEPDPPAPD